MNSYFSYNTNTTSNKANDTLPPIFPDFDVNSALSQKMLKAKTTNDGNYWPVMREVFLKDFNTLPKNRFKAWYSVMSVPFMTRFKIFDYVSIVIEMVRKDERYRYALEDPMVGYGTKDDFNLYSMFDDYNTTMNRIQHMAHLII